LRVLSRRLPRSSPCCLLDTFPHLPSPISHDHSVTLCQPLFCTHSYSSSESDTERADTAARLRVQSLSVQLPGAPAALLAQCVGDLFVVITVLENAQCDVCACHGGQGDDSMLARRPSCPRGHPRPRVPSACLSCDSPDWRCWHVQSLRFWTRIVCSTACDSFSLCVFLAGANGCPC
jgi:hypothetical protein